MTDQEKDTNSQFDIEQYTEPPRTKFLAEEYKRLMSQKEESLELAEDPEMAAMAAEDIQEKEKLMENPTRLSEAYLAGAQGQHQATTP